MWITTLNGNDYLFASQQAYKGYPIQQELKKNQQQLQQFNKPVINSVKQDIVLEKVIHQYAYKRPSMNPKLYGDGYFPEQIRYEFKMRPTKRVIYYKEQPSQIVVQQSRQPQPQPQQPKQKPRQQPRQAPKLNQQPKQQPKQVRPKQPVTTKQPTINVTINKKPSAPTQAKPAQKQTAPPKQRQPTTAQQPKQTPKQVTRPALKPKQQPVTTSRQPVQQQKPTKQPEKKQEPVKKEPANKTPAPKGISAVDSLFHKY